jgi:porphobilinogen deaminase
MTNILAALQQFDWKNLPPVGTTSARRQGFLRNTFIGAALDLKVLRGNVDTRLGRVAANEFSFIMLARAGIDRLNLFRKDCMLTLPTPLSIPAPAQGVVAIECRATDSELLLALEGLNHSQSSLSAALERTVLWLTGGNCHTALAVHHDEFEMNSWAEAQGHRCEMRFSLESQELQRWFDKARRLTHGQLFFEMRQSHLSRALHTQLLNSGYDNLMTLRSPDALD